MATSEAQIKSEIARLTGTHQHRLIHGGYINNFFSNYQPTQAWIRLPHRTKQRLYQPELQDRTE